MMTEIAGALKSLGSASLEFYWLPLALWSLMGLLVYALLKAGREANIDYQYHGRTALLLALPVGLAASWITSRLQDASGAAQSEIGARFIVIESPIHLPAVVEGASAPSLAVDWSDPTLWIGLLTVLILLVSLQQLLLFGMNLFGLRGFARSLETQPLSTQFRPRLQELRAVRRVRLAYSPDTEVPFTFGFFRPLIVLPGHLRHEEEKRRMSIRHELTHIQHGDYAMNALLMTVKALFWFHPLVHLLQGESRRYRELACDREVLSHSAISRKRYARLLLELAPGRVFHRKASVGMSVERNALKKRIEIMKSHKPSDTNMRSNLILALVTALFVTGIMACTDLQRSEVTGEHLLEQQLTFQEATIEINGVPFAGDEEKASPVLTMSGPANGILSLTLGRHGTFLLSGQQFGEAEAGATIEGNTLTLRRGGTEVVIRSDTAITGREKATLWVDHDPELVSPAPGDAPVIQTHLSTSHEEYLAFKEEQLARMEGETGDGGEQQDFFVAVENSPQLVGGLQALQAKISYPQEARRAGIEGQVIVQFIVDENGEAVNPEVIRNVHPILDEAAVEGIREHAEFKPGMQRGQPVRTQFSLPVVFRLSGGSGASSQPPPPPEPRPEGEDLSKEELQEAAGEALRQLREQGDLPTFEIRSLEISEGTVSGKLVESGTGDPLPTANVVVVEQSRGAATDMEGEFTIDGLEPGSATLRASHVGYENLRRSIRIDN